MMTCTSFSLFALLMLIIGLMGCSRSHQTTNNSLLPRGENFAQQRQACTTLTPYQDFFRASALPALFQCLGWDQQYPVLYDAVRKIDPQDWQQLTAPIHHTVLGSSTQTPEQRRQLRQRLDTQIAQQLALLGREPLDFQAFGTYLQELVLFFETYHFEPQSTSFTIDQLGQWQELLQHYHVPFKNLFTLYAKVSKPWSQYLREHPAMAVEFEQTLMKPPVYQRLASVLGLLGRIYRQAPAQLNLSSRALVQKTAQVFQAPWLQQVAQVFSREQSGQFIDTVLLLRPATLLPQLPLLHQTIDQGLGCGQHQFFLQEQFDGVLAHSPDYRPVDFYRELLDLRLKFLGVKEYCQAPNVADNLSLERLDGLLIDLSTVLIDVRAQGAMQAFQRALRAVDSDPLLLVSTLAHPQVQELTSALRELFEVAPLLKHCLWLFLTSLQTEDWQQIANILFDDQLWQGLSALEQQGLTPDLERLLLPLWVLLWKTPHHLEEISFFLHVFLPPDLLTEGLAAYQQHPAVFARLQRDFLQQPQVKEDLMGLLGSDSLKNLFDLLFHAADPGYRPQGHQEQKLIAPPSSGNQQIMVLAPDALDVEWQRCFVQLLALPVSGILDLAKMLPPSCLPLKARTDRDFAWRVLQDFAHLTLDYQQAYPKEKSVFDQWPIVSAPGFGFIMDLFLLSKSYYSLQHPTSFSPSAYEFLWADLETLFYRAPFIEAVSAALLLGQEAGPSSVGHTPATPANRQARRPIDDLPGLLMTSFVELLRPHWQQQTASIAKSKGAVMELWSMVERDVPAQLNLWQSLLSGNRSKVEVELVNPQWDLLPALLWRGQQEQLISPVEQLLGLAQLKESYFAAYLINQMAEAKSPAELPKVLGQLSQLLSALLASKVVVGPVYGLSFTDLKNLKKIKTLIPSFQRWLTLDQGRYLPLWHRLFKLLRAASRESAQRFHWLFGIKEKKTQGHMATLLTMLAQREYLTAVLGLLLNPFESLPLFEEWWQQWITPWREWPGEFALPVSISYEIQLNQDQWIHFSLAMKNLLGHWLEHEASRAALERFSRALKEQPPRFHLLFEGPSAGKSLSQLLQLETSQGGGLKATWDYYFNTYGPSLIYFADQAHQVLRARKN